MFFNFTLQSNKNVHLHLSISPDDAISGPVNGQSVRPPQVSSDDDPAIFAVHVSTPNVRLLPPVSPEQMADSKIVMDENTIYNGHHIVLLHHHSSHSYQVATPLQPRISGSSKTVTDEDTVFG